MGRRDDSDSRSRSRLKKSKRDKDKHRRRSYTPSDSRKRSRHHHSKGDRSKKIKKHDHNDRHRDRSKEKNYNSRHRKDSINTDTSYSNSQDAHDRKKQERLARLRALALETKMTENEDIKVEIDKHQKELSKNQEDGVKVCRINLESEIKELKEVEKLNERYKDDDRKMAEENFNKIDQNQTNGKNSNNNQVEISHDNNISVNDKQKAIAQNAGVMDELEGEDDEDKRSAKTNGDTAKQSDFDPIDLKRKNSQFDKWKKTKKEQDDEENAFLALTINNMEENEIELAPKKIQNLNLKEKFRHINQMIEEDKKHSSKNGLLKKANPEFSTMIKPEISITFDTQNLSSINAKTAEDDPLENYMKGQSSDAVKQESFGLSHHLNKHLPPELRKDHEDAKRKMEEEAIIITADMIANPEDILASNANRMIKLDDTNINNNELDLNSGQNMSQNFLENGDKKIEEDLDDEEGDQNFIEALKEFIDKPDIDETAAKIQDIANKENQDEAIDDKLSREKGVLCSDSDDDIVMAEEEKDIKMPDFFSMRDKIVEKKELKVTDHKTIEYETFKKDIYIESKEIKEMDQSEVEKIRRELGDIKIRGLNCPRPVQNWYQCGISDKILRVIVEKNKFATPFPIQCQAMPVIMAGRDCIGIAETGSGKTLAYVLPLLRHIKDQRPQEESEGPIGLVMVPTRELANQVYRDCKPLAKAIGLSCVCVYGGAGVAGQLSELKRGAEIVVCTPGRMIDVLTTSNGKITNLKRVTYIVQDEADRMFDMGFEPQISKIINNIRPDRQTVMFSATFPKNVETLAKKILSKPIEIVVGSRGQACKNVEQSIELIEKDNKILRLLEQLGIWCEKGSILIFVDRQEDADNQFAEQLNYRYKPLVQHGGQDQEDREFTIRDFKKGVRNILVSTSVASRGLDVKNLNLVVNYSCPTHREDYIHRIGRTGRAGNKGSAITFITTSEEEYAGDVIQALQMSSCEVPEFQMKLHKEFMKKVKKGEKKLYWNKNLGGKGYGFGTNELNGIIEHKDTMNKIVNEGEEIHNKLKSEEEKTKETRVSSQMENKVEKDKLKLFKDPNIREAIRKASIRAATAAIQAGASHDEVLMVSKNAIKDILKKCQNGERVDTYNNDTESLYKLRDEIVAKEEENSDKIIEVLEINSYPEPTRKACTHREYLAEMSELFQCKVTVRGQYVDPGLKIPANRRLHIHIEGDMVIDTQSAYDEIKRKCEESAIAALTKSYS